MKKSNATFEKCLANTQKETIEEVNRNVGLINVASDLTKAVDAYLIQGCLRSELKAANENLKRLLNDEQHLQP